MGTHQAGAALGPEMSLPSVGVWVNPLESHSEEGSPACSACLLSPVEVTVGRGLGKDGVPAGALRCSVLAGGPAVSSSLPSLSPGLCPSHWAAPSVASTSGDAIQVTGLPLPVSSLPPGAAPVLAGLATATSPWASCRVASGDTRMASGLPGLLAGFRFRLGRGRAHVASHCWPVLSSGPVGHSNRCL